MFCWGLWRAGNVSGYCLADRFSGWHRIGFRNWHSMVVACFGNRDRRSVDQWDLAAILEALAFFGRLIFVEAGLGSDFDLRVDSECRVRDDRSNFETRSAPDLWILEHRMSN